LTVENILATSQLSHLHHRSFTRPDTCKISDIKLDIQQPFKGKFHPPKTALLNEESDAATPTPTQPAANMASHKHLYGSCACERNQYAIAIPHSVIQDPSATAAASNLATVFFDNSRANRKSRSILF
jgi:hypothetical protein